MHKTSMQHFFDFFRNADSVRVVSFSSGSGQIRDTKYTSCILKPNFWAFVCETVCPMLSDHCLYVCLSCLSCLSVTLVYRDKTVGWIKTKVGTEVGLGPGRIVIDRNPAPLPKRGIAPNFRPNGWMDEDATYYGGRPWPWPHCVRYGQAPSGKGHNSSSL